MEKVLVGMSGGVDSSAAALLLKRGGYDVSGVTLKLFDGYGPDEERTCCSLSDVEDARSVCYTIGIEHYVFNFKDKFETEVMQNFADCYKGGETPNPCIRCNRFIKFDCMLRRAEELGFDYIATGHYARIERDDKTGRYLLMRPADRSKDQTYVLYGLTQRQLSRTLFPLYGMTKPQIRELAAEAGLVNSRKADSQDICFVPDGDYARFIERFTGEIPKKGFFTDKNGAVLAPHEGFTKYTVGQRRGLGIALGKPAFVVKKDVLSGNITLGDEADLFTRELTAGDVNLISAERIDEPLCLTAKTRYSQQDSPATVFPPDENGNLRIVFDTPQRAVTPGQAVVFYDGDIVVGGGTILP